MNVSDIINPSQVRADQTRSIRSTQRYSDPCPQRHYDQRREAMATGLMATQYQNRSPVFPRPYAPPSPPLDELHSLRTLPSIQSLIGMDSSQRASHIKELQMKELPPPSVGSPPRGERLADAGQPIVSHPEKRQISPLMDPRLVSYVDSQSPATTSSQSSFKIARFHSREAPGQSPPSPPPTSQVHNPSVSASHPPAPSPAFPPPPAASASYSYPLSTASAGHGNMYEQRPLPTTFPPSLPSTVNPLTPSSGETSPVDSNGGQLQQQQQHEHHHHMAPSTTTTFSGQPSDRYVCARCHKAFSRPSSLKIHVHSHTGEKPFICQHKGCGKAFSVRSNMKRHERGCHGSALAENG